MYGITQYPTIESVEPLSFSVASPSKIGGSNADTVITANAPTQIHVMILLMYRNPGSRAVSASTASRA